MIILILIISTTSCILIGGFFSGAETALVSIDKSILHSLANKKSKPAILAYKLLAMPSKLLATTLIGTNIFYVLATTLATLIVSHFADKEWQSLITTLIMTPMLLVFAELTPKALGREKTKEYVFIAAPVIFLVQKILRPLVITISFLSSGALRLFGIKESVNKFSTTREEVKILAEISEEHGLIGQIEKKMINRVFELNTTNLAAAMVPLIKLTTISIDADIDETLNLAKKTGYFKLPVYENNSSNIIGLINSLDLLDATVNYSDTSQLSLANFVDKSIPFMPESKLIGDALKELKQINKEIIFVVDEYGGVTGMVTIHDLAEEITGDLIDNSNVEKPFLLIHKNGVDCAGDYDIDELEDILNVKFDKQGYETIAGLILKIAGKIPARGESFQYKNLKITILRSDKKKIIRVRINKINN